MNTEKVIAVRLIFQKPDHRPVNLWPDPTTSKCRIGCPVYQSKMENRMVYGFSFFSEMVNSPDLDP